MQNVEDILNKLYDYYEVSGASELAKKIGVSPQNISNWKARNSINPLKTIIKQNGIYEKIFGESILRNASEYDYYTNHDKARILEKQCKKYDISTNFFIYDIKKTLNIIETMIKNNKKIEDKFHQYLKDFIKDNL